MSIRRKTQRPDGRLYSEDGMSNNCMASGNRVTNLNSTTMKSICFVATTPFAINAFLLGHLRALAGTYRVSLCVNVNAYPLSESLDPRVRVVNIGIRRKMSPLYDLHILWRLIHLFRQEHFDSVHSMTPKAGLLAMLAARIARIPRRYHTFTGQIWANRTGISRIFFKQIDRLIARSATKGFADSASQCLFLKSESVGFEKGISVLGAGSVCGVDATRFRPDQSVRTATRNALAVSEDTCVLLFIGRLAREKGVHDLVLAFSQLAVKYPQAALWIVGPDEEGLSSSLKVLVSECAGRVHWIGSTFEPEIYMASADILVLPSYREGFGMVIIEAAACGIPSVAYRIDGVTDAVQDGETGMLVPKGNINQLLSTLEKMLDNPAFRRELGEKARKRTIRDFSHTTVTTAWMEFYKSELGI